MKKLATLAILVALGLSTSSAQAFWGCGDVCAPKAPVCPSPCAPQMKAVPMEQHCGPCGEKYCCPKVVGFLGI